MLLSLPFLIGISGIYLFNLRLLHLWWLKRREIHIDDSGVCSFSEFVIQIPLFNEGVVIRPLFESLSKLTYPHFSVQVLDDSTEAESKRIVDEESLKLKS